MEFIFRKLGGGAQSADAGTNTITVTVEWKDNDEIEQLKQEIAAGTAGNKTVVDMIKPNYIDLELQKLNDDGEYETVAKKSKAYTSDTDYMFSSLEAGTYRVLETKIYYFDFPITIVEGNLLEQNVDGAYVSGENDSNYIVTHSKNITFDSNSGGNETATITNTFAKTSRISISVRWPFDYNRPQSLALDIVYKSSAAADAQWSDPDSSMIRFNELELSDNNIIGNPGDEEDRIWQLEVYNLPAAGLIYNDVTYQDEYVPLEYSVTGQYFISSIEGPTGHPDLTSGFDYEVKTENGIIEVTPYPLTREPLTVKKIWNDGTGSNDKAAAANYSAEVTLYYSVDYTNWEVLDRRTLNKGNNYMYTWKELPVMDDQDQEIHVYKIEETSCAGESGIAYVTEYYYQDDDGGILLGDGTWYPYEYYPSGYELDEGIGDTLYIVNTPSASAVVEKKWEVEDTTDLSNAEVKAYVCYQKSDGSWNYYYENTSQPVSKTLTRDSGWQEQVDNLPMYQIDFYSDGQRYIDYGGYGYLSDTYSGVYHTTQVQYRFEEYEITTDGTNGKNVTSQTDYRVSYEYSVSDGISKTTITNTSKNLATLTGTMTWVDSDNKFSTRPDDITLVVTESENNTATEYPADKVKWIKSEAADAWTYAITGIPAQSNGTAISYTVAIKEASGQGDAVMFDTGAAYKLTSSSLGTSDNVTTTNFTGTLVTGDLLISKTVEDMPEDEQQEDYDFNFKVKLQGTGNAAVYYTGDYTVYQGNVTAADINNSTAVSSEKTETDGIIKIAGGQKFYLKDLPAGYTYVVEEIPVQGFKIVTSPKGEIKEAQTVEGDVINQWAPTANIPDTPQDPDNPKPDKPDPDKPAPNSDTTETSDTGDELRISKAAAKSGDTPTDAAVNTTLVSPGSRTGDSPIIYLWMMLFIIGAAGTAISAGKLRRLNHQNK